VFAEVKESLAGNKQATQKLDGERFNFRALNELKFRKKYQIEIANKFAALKNLCDTEHI